MQYTVNDLFCGCGGMGLGFLQAGFKIQGAWDFDKYAVQTYKENIGNHVIQADITKMTYQDISYADVWSFGFPCQDLSVAGKQAGLFSGNRSKLFFEIMRLLDETNDNNVPLPAVLLAENVKGLKPYLPVLESEYTKRGYKLYYTLFNSMFWGVPQSRERYFVIGIRSDLPQTFEFPYEQKQIVPKLSSFIDSDVEDKYYVNLEKAELIIRQAAKKLAKLGNIHATITPDRVEKRQNGRSAKEEEEPMFTLTAQDLHGVIINDQGRRSRDPFVSNLAPTLRANTHNNEPKILASALIHGRGLEIRNDDLSHCIKGAEGGSSKNHLVQYNDNSYSLRRLTPVEYGRLQGFPMNTWKQIVSDTQAYKQFGNAVTVNVAKAVALSIKTYLEKVLI